MVTRTRDLIHALDPAAWAADVLGWRLDEWQQRLLRSNAQQAIVLCSRQTGKTTVAAIMALHTALFRAPALCLVLSPTLRQSQEAFRRVRDQLAHLPSDAAPVAEESALRVEFANGSRIIALPGTESTIRGYSGVQLLIVDEAARVEDGLYYAVTPMLATSAGRMLLLSSPAGQAGVFFKVWTEGGDEWLRTRVLASDVPRIPPAFLERERRQMPARLFRQEYECSFEATDDAIFEYATLQSTLVDGVPLFEMSEEVRPDALVA